MPNIKKGIRQAANKAKGPAKRIAKAAARQALNELRGGARSFIRGHPLVNAGIRNLLGNGDYQMNSLVRGNGRGVPSFGVSRVIISKREYVGRVVSSPTPGTFLLQKFTINPGLPATFPWLSQIAASFESYKPRGIIFEYKSTSGESVGSTNTALGAVVMAAQYNSFAPDPTSRYQQEAFPNAVSVAPFQDALCGVECKPGLRNSNSLFVRNPSTVTPVGLASDALFDLADFFISSDGCQGSSVALGELWVTYSIELFNPVLTTATGSRIAAHAGGTIETQHWGSLAHPALTHTSGSLTWATVDQECISVAGLVPGRRYSFRMSVWSGENIDSSMAHSSTGLTVDGGFATVDPTASSQYWVATWSYVATATNGTIRVDFGTTATACNNLWIQFEEIPDASFWP